MLPTLDHHDSSPAVGGVRRGRLDSLGFEDDKRSRVQSGHWWSEIRLPKVLKDSLRQSEYSSRAAMFQTPLCRDQVSRSTPGLKVSRRETPHSLPRLASIEYPCRD